MIITVKLKLVGLDKELRFRSPLVVNVMACKIIVNEN